MAVLGRLSVILLAATAAGASAQRAPRVRTGAQLGAAVERTGDRWAAGPRAALDLRLDRPWLSVAGGATLEGGGAMPWRGSGDIRATLVTPSASGLRAALDAEHATNAARASDGLARSRAAARVGWSGARGGVWAFGEVAEVDVRAFAPHDTGGSRSSGVALVQGLGTWRQFRALMVSVRLSSHSARLGGRHASRTDSLVERRIETDTGSHVWWERVASGDSTLASRRTRWAETELRLAWTGERAMLDAMVGARPAMSGLQRRATWAELGGALRIRRSLWLDGALGLIPERPDLGLTHRRFARVGLRLSSGTLPRARNVPEPRAAPTAFSLDATGDGAYLVTIRLPQARTVEISGDFSAWKPVPLAQVGPGRWETVIPLSPGTHRLSVRVDGDRWTAPPGAAAVEDDFGGAAGIVVVR